MCLRDRPPGRLVVDLSSIHHWTRQPPAVHHPVCVCVCVSVCVCVCVCVCVHLNVVCLQFAIWICQKWLLIQFYQTTISVCAAIASVSVLASTTISTLINAHAHSLWWDTFRPHWIRQSPTLRHSGVEACGKVCNQLTDNHASRCSYLWVCLFSVAAVSFIDSAMFIFQRSPRVPSLACCTVVRSLPAKFKPAYAHTLNTFLCWAGQHHHKRKRPLHHPRSTCCRSMDVFVSNSHDRVKALARLLFQYKYLLDSYVIVSI